MKPQTFISVLEDKEGQTVTFERWNYVKLKTCIKNLVALYKTIRRYEFVKRDLAKTNKIVTYKTSYETNEDNKVHEMSIEEFLKMLE